MNKKNILIIVLSILVLILLLVIGFLIVMYINKPTDMEILDNDTSLEEDVVEEVVTYNLKLTSTSENKYDVELINSKTLESRKIASNAYEANINSDNTLVAYIIADTESSTSSDVFIYNIEKNSATSYLTNRENSNGVSWSPDGKYLLIESGTYLTRMYTPINYQTKEELTKFITSENVTTFKQYYWIDSLNIVYMSMSNVSDSVNKPAGTGLLTQITKINIETGETSILALPEMGIEYSFTEELPSNGFIKIKQLVYTEGTITDTNFFNLNLESGELTTIE